MEATLTMSIIATPKGSTGQVEFRIPTTFYIADIRDSVILSYDWCRRRGVDISPKEHGLVCHKGGVEYWVEGIRNTKHQGSDTIVNTLTSSTVAPKALDLFSGTGSTSRTLQEAGFDMNSVDIDPCSLPTFCENILDWEYRRFPPGYFDLITASPPCTEFSRAKSVGPRNLDTADQLVLKTLEIVHYFQPKRWWLETPRYGELPKRPYMAKIPFWDVDYCQVSLCGFKKPTRIFGSQGLQNIPPPGV